jgi:hypothetical protein
VEGKNADSLWKTCSLGQPVLGRQVRRARAPRPAHFIAIAIAIKTRIVRRNVGCFPRG